MIEHENDRPRKDRGVELRGRNNELALERVHSSAAPRGDADQFVLRLPILPLRTNKANPKLDRNTVETKRASITKFANSIIDLIYFSLIHANHGSRQFSYLIALANFKSAKTTTISRPTGFARFTKNGLNDWILVIILVQLDLNDHLEGDDEFDA